MTRQQWLQAVRQYEQTQTLPKTVGELVIQFLASWGRLDTLGDDQPQLAAGLELLGPALLLLCADAVDLAREDE